MSGLRIGAYYPKSFFKLLVLAFAIVALPLILAFINAALFVEKLAGQSETVVAQAAQAARESRMLMEQVTALERVTRQFLILNDRTLLDDFDRVRSRFKRTTSALSLLPLDDAQLRQLNRAIDVEQSLSDRLRAQRGALLPAQRRQFIEGYIELNDVARGVLDMSNALIDREVEQMRVTAARAESILWWQLLATLPLGVLLAVGVTFAVARPIRQLDQAIRSLGTGKFERSVTVSGPADLAYLGERLEWLRGRLAELESQKSRFLRHVSHELKTPLTSLCEGAELLGDGTGGPITDTQREIVDILRKQSARLQELIEDLLDYQTAYDSVAHLELADADLDRMVAAVAQDHRLAASANGIRIDIRTEAVRLRCDVEKLRVVVDNLLSNAVKHSPAGGTIAVVLAREGNRIYIDVSDGGPGIPESERERVFDWFYRGQQPEGSRFKASGFGLAIARDFVEAHGGHLEIVDDGAPGAHFRVILLAGT